MPSPMNNRRSLAAILGIFLMASFGPVAAQSGADRLVAAYPDFLARHDGVDLFWKDGARLPLSDGGKTKSFDEKLKSPSLLDQMELPYPKGRLTAAPGAQDDPGRFRNVAFFDKMYGDCAKGEVAKRLVRVAWLPKAGGGAVMATPVNGVAERLRRVSEELDGLKPDVRAYAFPSAGTFNCRPVQDTGNRSVHAWGAAIDLNTKFADYWLWRKNAPYRNRLPYEIVEIFERNGFIWGGKWGHYDTMHFEYRPELL